MRNGRAESTVGIPEHQDPNAHCEWDEDEFVAEFLDEEVTYATEKRQRRAP